MSVFQVFGEILRKTKLVQGNHFTFNDAQIVFLLREIKFQLLTDCGDGH